MSAVLAITGYVSNVAADRAAGGILRWRGWSTFLSGWVQFDGVRYLDIARDGYDYVPGRQSTVVWFPLYPLLIRLVGALTGDPVIAGVLITWVAGLIAVRLLWIWMPLVGVEAAHRGWSLAALMLYPYAWYLYGPVYSDAVFLALVIGAFILVETRHPIATAVAVAAATATRSMGPFLIPALVLLSLERSGALSAPEGGSRLVQRWRLPVRFDRRRLDHRAFAPVLGLAGIGLYMWHLGVRFGDPVAFLTNQETYHLGRLPLLKARFFVVWRDRVDMSLPLTLTAQACFAALVIWCIPAVGRRFGWGYGLFVFFVVGVPTATTAEFLGTGRYLLAAFPVAVLIGERMAAHRRLAAAWLAVSAVALVGLNMGFSRSWYLS